MDSSAGAKPQELAKQCVATLVQPVPPLSEHAALQPVQHESPRSPKPMQHSDPEPESSAMNVAREMSQNEAVQTPPHKAKEPQNSPEKGPLEVKDSTVEPFSPCCFRKLDVEKFASQLGTQKGNPEGKLHVQATECVFCGRAKHSCAWQYRITLCKPQLTKVTGSQCASCVQACAKLKCGRNIRVCKETPGVLRSIQKMSKQIALEKQHGSGTDKCRCSDCRLPTRRLRHKTEFP